MIGSTWLQLCKFAFLGVEFFPCSVLFKVTLDALGEWSCRLGSRLWSLDGVRLLKTY